MKRNVVYRLFAITIIALVALWTLEIFADEMTGPAANALTPLGFLSLLALACGLVTRLIKSDTLDALLAKLHIPALPRAAIPYISIAIGIIGAFVQAKAGGAATVDALKQSLMGIFAGGVAVAGHEALAPDVRNVLGVLLFGHGSQAMAARAEFRRTPESTSTKDC